MALTLVTRTALGDFSRVATSFCLRLASVGAAGCGKTATWSSLYLSLKLTPPGSSRRAQPSGTLTENPSGDLNATKAWLSGMSPGGFFSAAMGCCGLASGVVPVWAEAIDDSAQALGLGCK